MRLKLEQNWEKCRATVDGHCKRNGKTLALRRKLSVKTRPGWKGEDKASCQDVERQGDTCPVGVHWNISSWRTNINERLEDAKHNKNIAGPGAWPYSRQYCTNGQPNKTNPKKGQRGPQTDDSLVRVPSYNLTVTSNWQDAEAPMVEFGMKSVMNEQSKYDESRIKEDVENGDLLCDSCMLLLSSKVGG